MNKLSLVLISLLASVHCLAADPRTEEVAFLSHGVKLAGSIVLPAGDVQAAVVFIHGSGKQSRNTHLAERFARAGIATLVYDKRGAGESGGEYEGDQSVSGRNVALLADDAFAALTRLATHPAVRGRRAGFVGISQAGWIAPLAAKRGGAAQFLVLWSGPVCKVSEEDIFSKYTTDADQDVVPAYETALRARAQKYLWPDFLGRDTDSGEDLAALKIPGLWLFSDNDASIPVDLSIAKLTALRRAGHRYEYALFSGYGHDNIDRTFAFVVDWIARLPKQSY
jgi:uncharacterized protein